ncbi:glycosyltransferase family 2 protein [Aquirufa sp. ROCK-SH2]
MSSITAIILTFNEEIHLERCIKSLQSFCARICVVDSFSTDNTVEIAKSLGADVYQNKWENNYAKQLNWAIENCQISTAWTLRVDADEHFPIEIQQEISNKLNQVDEDVFGIELTRRIVFKGSMIRFGGFKEFKLLRIWRTGHGICEQRLMDEHIVLDEGKVVSFDHYLIDENLNSMHWWVNKHNNYARREAADAINLEYHLMETTKLEEKSGVKEAILKRVLKNKVYHHLPLGLRPLLYFFYRFVIRLGFLDHPKVWIFHFMQGLWYRLLVDITIYELKNLAKGDVEVMKEIILNDWRIKFED